ncbi:histidine kinase HAMP region domain protein [Solidesulfovibrio carbinoliphilus subsp. oakridgensis]|uniref:Histidine kinase HAMP region domain protein n=1 Tax=Solidesulfovibrio carbinoliphilus subsp. oakridgensis TaxID=694327 RepID=G7Q9C3_9BACT|nr:HAMP domain-containing protein [Solidesulfovibrio carbinoliphilus]EHJ48166.1 histidine kinase HAMP region domain protein [Solidesulfovibrio carbinoliphilus subsp. oakridgensis]
MRFPLFPVAIGLAVGLPAVAALLLGLFAVSRLDALSERSRALETARLPRADLAVSVERRLLLAAQAIRGYALTADREALERAKKDLAKAADALHDAREAASRPGMEGLAAEAGKIGYFLDAYKKAAEGSVVANERVADARAALARAAEAYLAAAAAYQELKTATWDKDLSVKYPVPDTLRQDARRQKAAQAALDAGRDVREAAETARASRDPALLAEAAGRFEAAEAALREARGTGDEDGRRVAAAFAALAEYRQSVAALLTDWEALRATGRQILEAERAALSAATALGGASLAEAAGDVGGLAASLRTTRLVLGGAGWAILLLGAAFAVAMAVLLGRPVRRCALFARDLSVGRLTGNLDASGPGELGLLAESLREMARRLGKRLAR